MNIFHFIFSRAVLLILCLFVNYYLMNDIEIEYLKGLSQTLTNLMVILLLVSIIFQIVISGYRRKVNLLYPKQDNIVAAVNNIYKIIFIIGVFVAALSLFNIKLSTVFTSISIVAAAIAIVTKEELSAILCGFIITFSKNISIGDFVKIGTYKGQIKQISLTKTHLLTLEDELIFIPNYEVQHSEITNYSKYSKSKIHFPLQFSAILQQSSLRQLEKEIFHKLEKELPLKINTVQFQYKEMNDNKVMIDLIFEIHKFRLDTIKKAYQIAIGVIIDFININQLIIGNNNYEEHLF